MHDNCPPVVLIVEDEFLIRMMLAETLVDQGFDVIEAGTADEAVPHLRQNPAIALMITDLTLPGAMDGLGLAQWVRTHRADLPIIYVTGRPDAIRADGLGTRDAIVAKPYLPSEIAAAAVRMLSS
jgi:DNA-binding response OmpR family regulator